jgi:POT family
MFKPNVSPTLLDQIKETKPTVETLDDGEKVIIDPEATTERVVLWFYLLINIGGFLAVPSTYLEKYVGWMVTFTLPLALYLPLPLVLWWLHKRLTVSLSPICFICSWY